MLKLANLDYTTGAYTVEEREIIYRSSLSPQWIKAAGLFDAFVAKAKEDDIDLFTTEKRGEIELSVPNETYHALNAELTASLIEEWPFDIDMMQELTENQALCNILQNLAHDKTKDFLKKKNS